MYQFFGLNLLKLLSQNRIAEFHTELELLDASHLHDNIYIKHPVALEQYLMEGSYNKIMLARNNVPAPSYVFFIDELMGTIRNEIADCSEKAYTSLPFADARKILYLSSSEEVTAFAQQRGWNLVGGAFVFESAVRDTNEVPSTKLILQNLNYARELEKIV
eukprot:Colp12_sorted_trinity150504_noHs@11942